ncbi:hypothetical protein HL653_20055 [Sphingomonas sp. AP4-R1]|uniref:hypothetical protein n=1 Tax=Sphingomonas sp. AP4-R1 TaxID=2735134 RepID=UPI00149398DC|nr:hypothetical protein [Sphingomonas sp. AP4-R1]QJU59740.1 hypothetical protein HL653_20055 [Sphingomonas sp. AP4-R1]
MIASLALAVSTASVLFRAYVPPHMASDGVRYEVRAAASVDLPGSMKTCGIDDFERVAVDGAGQTYKFAVTRSTEANAQCLRARLPQDARIQPRDNWMTNAQAD